MWPWTFFVCVGGGVVVVRRAGAHVCRRAHGVGVLDASWQVASYCRQLACGLWHQNALRWNAACLPASRAVTTIRFSTQYRLLSNREARRGDQVVLARCPVLCCVKCASVYPLDRTSRRVPPCQETVRGGGVCAVANEGLWGSQSNIGPVGVVGGWAGQLLGGGRRGVVTPCQFGLNSTWLNSIAPISTASTAVRAGALEAQECGIGPRRVPGCGAVGVK